MTKMFFSVLAPLTAAAVAGCSSTGTPEPEPIPDFREELATGIEVPVLHSNGTTTTRGTATVQMAMDDSTLSIDAGGTTYNLTADGASAVITEPSWSNPVNYARYPFTSGTGNAALITGQYAFLAGLGTASDYYMLQGGLTTPAEGLPDMLAEYEGFWAVEDNGGAYASGIFDAAADFDAGTIAFDVNNSSGTPLGTGAGTISGSTFDSSFNVTGGSATSVNNLEGSFYGPNAGEIGGLMEGSGIGETLGYIIGHQK